MKKLYQVNVKTEILVPEEIDKIKFLELIGGEENLGSEYNFLCASENEDDAVLEAFAKYVESALGNGTNYVGAIGRGERRNKYTINISLSTEEDTIDTKVLINLEPQDLGV